VDGRVGPRSLTNRAIVEPTHDPTPQTRTVSNKVLTLSNNKSPRKRSTPKKKVREAAKFETRMRVEFPPSAINRLATDMSNEAVSNEHIRAAVAVGNSNVSYSDGVEMARVDSESYLDGAGLSQSQIEDDDEYFKVEAITGCKLGSRVCCFEVLYIYSNYDFFSGWFSCKSNGLATRIQRT
jgi:hypothetical protein